MTKKRFAILFVSITLCIGLGAFFMWVTTHQQQPKVTINGYTFFVEVARTDQEREKGLSHHSPLPRDAGMLFVFPSAGKYSFWMKDMLFPIDIIFIHQNKIVNIFKNVLVPPAYTPDNQLPLYTPTNDADSVLELHAGISDTYGFKVGDTVSH